MNLHISLKQKIRKFGFSYSGVFVLVIHCLTSMFHTDDVSVVGRDMPTGLLTSTFGRQAPFVIRGSTDQMAQEGDEVFTIPLSVTSQNLPTPVFVAGPATVTVIDTTGTLIFSIMFIVYMYMYIDCFKY